MNQRSLWIISATVLAVLIAAAGWLFLTFHSKHQALSVKPELSYPDLQLEPLQSNIGLHTRLPFRSLIRAAEHTTQEPQTGKGEKQNCKRVLGARVCATLKWQYSITRDGAVRIEPQGKRLQVQLPISFTGLVSIDGPGGKLLGLRDKDIDGKLVLLADLDVKVNSNWCPVIDSSVSYRWRSDPQITLVGSLRINLRKSVDKALQRKLAELKNLLSEVIDCQELRQSIQAQWRTHRLNVQMRERADSELVITPVNAAVSQLGIQHDHISLSVDLGAYLQLLMDEASQSSDISGNRSADEIPLPPLLPHGSTPGVVEISLLMQVPYTQLTDKLASEVVGKTYTSGSSNSLTISSIDVYPANELLIIDVGFEASALSSLIKTTGNVYISTRPVADPVNNLLYLQDLQLTRTIDSRLLSALTTILRQQLLNALQDASTIDLGSSMAKIEQSIAETLGNPDKTAGIRVDAQSPEVRLMTLTPQATGVAAILHLSTRLNATIPEDVLIR